MRLIRNLFTALLFLILPVSGFAQTEKQGAFGVLIDNTGSMRTQFGNIQILAKSVARNLSRRGDVAVFNFETQSGNKNQFAVVSSGTRWSRNSDALENYIGNLQVVPGSTALLNSVLSIAKAVETKSAAEKPTEKFIVLITDGEDRSSEITEKQLLKELTESNIKVYAIGLVKELETERSLFGVSDQEKATKFLKKITKETGGNVIFPKLKKDAKFEDLLTELFAEQSKN